MAVSPVSLRMRRIQSIALGLATAAITKIREEFGINATAIGAAVTVLGTGMPRMRVQSQVVSADLQGTLVAATAG